MSNWQAHAETSNFGTEVNLQVGREVFGDRAEGERFWDIITTISDASTISRLRAEESTLLPHALTMPHGAAEALYKALDRVFGMGETVRARSGSQEGAGPRGQGDRGLPDIMICKNCLRLGDVEIDIYEDSRGVWRHKATRATYCYNSTVAEPESDPLHDQ